MAAAVGLIAATATWGATCGVVPSTGGVSAAWQRNFEADPHRASTAMASRTAGHVVEHMMSQGWASTDVVFSGFGSTQLQYQSPGLLTS